MIDSIMTIGLLIMLSLYGGWLVWVVLGLPLLCAIMRALTYKFLSYPSRGVNRQTRVLACILWSRCWYCDDKIA